MLDFHLNVKKCLLKIQGKMKVIWSKVTAWCNDTHLWLSWSGGLLKKEKKKEAVWPKTGDTLKC
mgnify:CR=1 FL=1